MIHDSEEEQDHPDLTKIFEKVNDNLDMRMQYLRYNFSEKVAVVIGKAGGVTVVVVLFLLFFFFLNVAAALWIGRVVNDNIIGFAAVSGFYFIITLLFLLLRKPVIEKKIEDAIVKSIYTDNEDDEENED